MFAIWKKEFKAYFHSVIGWLFVAALLALFGLYFYAYNLMQGYPYVYYSLSSVTIIFLIAVPVLTMRSFAEERKNRTDQLMLTAPVSVGKIVLGKYLAMVSVFSVDVLLFTAYPAGFWYGADGRKLYLHSGILAVRLCLHCGRHADIGPYGESGNCGGIKFCRAVYQLYDAGDYGTDFIRRKLADGDIKLSGSLCTV